MSTKKNNNIDVRLHDKYANRKKNGNPKLYCYVLCESNTENQQKNQKKYDILSQIVIYVKLPGLETKNHTLTMRTTTER